jgi:hypothetical protein
MKYLKNEISAEALAKEEERCRQAMNEDFFSKNFSKKEAK